MQEATIVAEHNGVKCDNCDNWIDLETALDIGLRQVDEEVSCCEKPDYKQHSTPLVSVEELKDEISIGR